MNFSELHCSHVKHINYTHNSERIVCREESVAIAGSHVFSSFFFFSVWSKFNARGSHIGKRNSLSEFLLLVSSIVLHISEQSSIKTTTETVSINVELEFLKVTRFDPTFILCVWKTLTLNAGKRPTKMCVSYHL